MTKLIFCSKKVSKIVDNLRFYGYSYDDIKTFLAVMSQPSTLKNGVLDYMRICWSMPWSPNPSFPFSDSFKSVFVTYSKYSGIYRFYTKD